MDTGLFSGKSRKVTENHGNGNKQIPFNAGIFMFSGEENQGNPKTMAIFRKIMEKHGNHENVYKKSQVLTIVNNMPG
jgi:hypothetical protein